MKKTYRTKASKSHIKKTIVIITKAICCMRLKPVHKKGEGANRKENVGVRNITLLFDAGGKQKALLIEDE